MTDSFHLAVGASSEMRGAGALALSGERGE